MSSVNSSFFFNMCVCVFMYHVGEGGQFEEWESKWMVMVCSKLRRKAGYTVWPSPKILEFDMR